MQCKSAMIKIKWQGYIQVDILHRRLVYKKHLGERNISKVFGIKMNCRFVTVIVDILAKNLSIGCNDIWRCHCNPVHFIHIWYIEKKIGWEETLSAFWIIKIHVIF